MSLAVSGQAGADQKGFEAVAAMLTAVKFHRVLRSHRQDLSLHLLWCEILIARVAKQTCDDSGDVGSRLSP